MSKYFPSLTYYLFIGFWMDVGQPNDFLKGTSLYLNYLKQSDHSKELATGSNIHGNVLIVSYMLFIMFLG